MNEVLGLSFSPRQGGNSDLLLDEFLRGVHDSGAGVRVVYARDLEIEACTECGGCDETGECVLEDDMDDLYPVLVETRRIVVASPIFFYGLPGRGKAMVDRCQALWNRVRLNPGLRRPDGRGFFMSVGATKGKDLFEGSILTIKYFFDALGLPTRVESLTYRRIEAKGAVKDHPTALADAYQAGLEFGRD